MYICNMNKLQFKQEMLFLGRKRNSKRYLAIYEHNQTTINSIILVQISDDVFFRDQEFAYYPILWN